MRALDDYLFDHYFQPWSEEFEEWSEGRHTCFFLSAVVGSIAVAAYMCMMWLLGILPLSVGAGITILALWYHWKVWPFPKERQYGNLLVRAMNEDRASVLDMYLRVYSVCLLCVFGALVLLVTIFGHADLSDFCWVVYLLFLPATLYFAACTPKPPNLLRQHEYVPQPV